MKESWFCTLVGGDWGGELFMFGGLGRRDSPINLHKSRGGRRDDPMNVWGAASSSRKSSPPPSEMILLSTLKC